MEPNPAPPAPSEPKTTASVTFSAPAALTDVFTSHARGAYGIRGVSQAGREAMSEWLARRGVTLTDPVSLKKARRLAMLDQLESLQIDVEGELAAIRDRAGATAPAMG